MVETPAARSASHIRAPPLMVRVDVAAEAEAACADAGLSRTAKIRLLSSGTNPARVRGTTLLLRSAVAERSLACGSRVISDSAFRTRLSPVAGSLEQGLPNRRCLCQRLMLNLSA